MEHTMPSPFPRPSSGGGQIIDELCTCGHHRSRHQDTTGYGSGSCTAHPLKRPCRCAKFVRADNIYRHSGRHPVHSARGLRRRIAAPRSKKVGNYGLRTEDGTFSAVEVRIAPSSRPRGTTLGVGADPAHAIGAAIQRALDPTTIPGRVRTLAEMSPAERARLETELGATISTPAGAQPAAWHPTAADLQLLRLGPVHQYDPKWRDGRTLPRRMLFAVQTKYSGCLRRAAGHLHARRERNVNGYSLDESRWKQAQAWGVIEVDEATQNACLLD